MADNWKVAGLRASPDGEVCFVIHYRDKWTVAKGRNKALDAWLEENPQHEQVPLGEAPDKSGAMRLAAKLVKGLQAKDGAKLQRQRGSVTGRRKHKNKPSARGPRRAAAPTKRAAGAMDCSFAALKRALAKAGWTVEEEIRQLVEIARDNGNTRQMAAIEYLHKRRLAALAEAGDEAKPDPAMDGAAMRHGGSHGEEADGQGEEGGEGPDGRAGGGVHQGGEGRDHGRPRGAVPGEREEGAGIGEESGWVEPSDAIPGTGGLAN